MNVTLLCASSWLVASEVIAADDIVCEEIEVGGAVFPLGISRDYLPSKGEFTESYVMVFFQYVTMEPKPFPSTRFEIAQLAHAKEYEQLRVLTTLSIDRKTDGAAVHIPSDKYEVPNAGAFGNNWRVTTSCWGCGYLHVSPAVDQPSYYLACPDPEVLHADPASFSCTVYDLVNQLNVRYSVPLAKLDYFNKFRSDVFALTQKFVSAGQDACGEN